MIRLLKRARHSAERVTSLPEEVAAAIETICVIPRSEGGRVLVQFRGYAPFVYNLEGANAYFRSAFAELNDEQVARAVRFLDSTVAKRTTMQHPTESRSSWSSWKPLDRFTS